MFEVTEQTHLKTGNDKGGKALHPYGQDQHPHFPVERDMFDKDRIQYWKDRFKKLQH